MVVQFAVSGPDIVQSLVNIPPQAMPSDVVGLL